jgi:hypothetical protein
MTDKPIRRVTSAWLNSTDRWRHLTPTAAPPAPVDPALPQYTPVQRALLTALDQLGGAAHVTELEERMEASGRMVIDVAHSLKRVVKVTRDRDSEGQPLMVLRRPEAA